MRTPRNCRCPRASSRRSGSCRPRILRRAGDILVFLPGEKHIREAALALQRARLPQLEVMPLFARLTTQQQERIFEAHTHAPGDPGNQCRRDVPDRTPGAPRHRQWPGAHQPLQRPHQGAAAAAGTHLQGQRQPAPRPLRARGAGHLHPAVFGRGLRGARGVHAPGDPAHPSGERAAADGGFRTGRSGAVPVSGSAGHAPDQ